MRLESVCLLAALAWLLAGCFADDTPPRSFTAPSYTYLRPLRLSVATVDIDAASPIPVSGRDIAALSPVVPTDALRQMATDRLLAAGASGSARFSIEQASITRVRGMLNGLLKIRLDVATSAGKPAAFAEAAVARSATDPDDGEQALRGALYDLTRQMMSDMNVEFEFQARRALGDWLQAAGGVAPPVAVQQQALPPPSSVPVGLAPRTGQPGSTTPDTPAPPAQAYPPGTRFRLVPTPAPGTEVVPNN